MRYILDMAHVVVSCKCSQSLLSELVCYALLLLCLFGVLLGLFSPLPVAATGSHVFASLSNSSFSTNLLFNFQASDRSPEILPEFPLGARTHARTLLLSTRVFGRGQVTSSIAAAWFNVPPGLIPPPHSGFMELGLLLHPP